MNYHNYLNQVGHGGALHIDLGGSDTTKFGVYSVGTTKLYPFGSRYDIDERSFLYCYAGAACNPGYGAAYYNQYVSVATATAQSIGDMTIDITVTTTAFTKDELQGGYYSQPDGTCKQFRRILGNSACASGGITRLFLDGPFTRTLVANSFAELMRNPCSDVRGGPTLNNEYVTYFGVPATTIASTYYGWVQTWGPTWATPQTPVADTANWRTVVFQSNGSIRGFDDAIGETGHMVAGHVIDRTGSGSDNPPFIYLTCSR